MNSAQKLIDLAKELSLLGKSRPFSIASAYLEEFSHNNLGRMAQMLEIAMEALKNIAEPSQEMEKAPDRITEENKDEWHDAVYACNRRRRETAKNAILEINKLASGEAGESGEYVVNKLNFNTELQKLINKHSLEQYSNTPDFILANYISGCLAAFELAMNSRDSWFGPNEKNTPECATEKKK
jgi:hypothetical protein